MRQQLIDRIFHAFEGVVLDDGISLHETAVLDQFGQNERYMGLRKQARSRDELIDWTKLVGKKFLRRMAPFALTGLDGLGLRYYAPPCLITILRQDIPTDSTIFVPFIWNASRIAEGSNWQLYSLPQLEIIRDCLLHFTPYTDSYSTQFLNNGIEATSRGITWKT